ncbi:QWRF motif-containing protein 2 [Phtheirospermum japonicum]|uniref:QWRF motif-containing protein 2 n=1 Tax=Phtheirospermum japonicum TaxID=374723 RepID=A0A830CTU3_9LAMI|nr:QWRF motif-containing protein 2 [Phtheirospermum japonicum]
MVAAVSGVASDPQNPKTTAAASQDEHSRRPPLLPSEKDRNNYSNSNGASNNNNQRKPKSRVVSSRYMSPSTSSTSTSNSSSISSSSSSSSSLSVSRRFPSPSFSRNSSNPPSVGPKRSVSVDRRRTSASPAAVRPLLPDLDSKNGNAAEISAATKLLVTSTRSLSVSFQGEAFSLPISKTKAAPPSPNLRKGTPERRRSNTPSRDHVENSKPSDQNHHHHHRWPARNRLSTSTALSKSLDCSELGVGDNKSKLIRGLQRSVIINEKRPDSVVNELSAPCDLIQSDSDSVSSDSTSGAQECSANGPRGLSVSARFWQETNSRLRRLQDPGSPLSTSPGSKLIVPPKSKRYSSDSPLSSPRTISSPGRGAMRPASPAKLMGSSPLRAHSPSRIRNAVSTICNNFLEMPSVLSFAVDVRRGKVGENRIVDAHLLRLMYNRHLQWRFVNARTEAVLMVQRRSAEKNLWNAWIAISDLRDTVTKKRHRLQLLRQKLKLASILRGQIALFEDWSSLEKDHSVSLVGAIEALKATTLRLPVVGGAIANVQSLKDATGSAVDVMQAMASSICSLLPISRWRRQKAAKE